MFTTYKSAPAKEQQQKKLQSSSKSLLTKGKWSEKCLKRDCVKLLFTINKEKV